MTKQEGKALVYSEAQMYSVAVWYSADDCTFIARCMEIPGADAAGRRPDIALRYCYGAIEDFLAHSKKLGFKPPEPGAAKNWFAQKLRHTIAMARRKVKTEQRYRS